MARLADVLHVPPIAALLTASLAPKDAMPLMVVALEMHLHDAARQLLTQWTRRSTRDKSDKTGRWERLVCCAAASGCRVALTRLSCYSTMDDLIQNQRGPPVSVQLPASVVYEAAKQGDLSTVQWLCPLTAFEPHVAMVIAARARHLVVASWIGQYAQSTVGTVEMRRVDVGARLVALMWTAPDPEAEGAFITSFATAARGMAPTQRGTHQYYVGAMDVVASQGDLAILQALANDAHYQWSCTPAAMDTAAAHGHLHVLRWLLDHRTEGCTQLAMNNAARYGHVAVMTWLLDHQPTLTVAITVSTLLTALEGGHVDVLSWIHDHEPSLWVSGSPSLVSRSRLVEAACDSPHRLRVLQWLDDVHDIRLATKPAMSFVLGQGDVATAQWLADPTGDGSHLVEWNWIVAKWMSYEFALWHSGTFAKAAVNGHLHIVEWLAHAGPFHKVDAHTLWQCAQRGHLPIVVFILQRPQHQPNELEFLPQAWSSFYDAMKDDDDRQGSVRCEWDPLACDPWWAKLYVELWLLYRPADCKRVEWLAPWAEHCGYDKLAQRLKD